MADHRPDTGASSFEAMHNAMHAGMHAAAADATRREARHEPVARLITARPRERRARPARRTRRTRVSASADDSSGSDPAPSLTLGAHKLEAVVA